MDASKFNLSAQLELLLFQSKTSGRDGHHVAWPRYRASRSFGCQCELRKAWKSSQVVFIGRDYSDLMSPPFAERSSYIIYCSSAIRCRFIEVATFSSCRTCLYSRQVGRSTLSLFTSNAELENGGWFTKIGKRTTYATTRQQHRSNRTGGNRQTASAENKKKRGGSRTAKAIYKV